MAGPTGMPQSIGSPSPQFRNLNPQILNALFLVEGVRTDMQRLLPQALATGSVTVGEARIRSWQTALQTALQLVQQVPVILIFPPPPIAQFLSSAAAQIEQALSTLQAIPIASPLIFPPQPGQATLSLQTLQSLLGNLQQASFFLVQALFVG